MCVCERGGRAAFGACAAVRCVALSGLLPFGSVVASQALFISKRGRRAAVHTLSPRLGLRSPS